MKQKIILLCLCLVCTGLSTYAQWVVSDPTNLAQGIVNSTKQVVEAAKNGSTMLQSFQETVKIYRRMVGDENFTPAELAAIAAGYARIIEESAGELKELQDIVNPTDMSLTDKDRIDVVQRVYGVLRRHRDLARYYTRKNISISLLRAARKRDMEGVLSLYGTDEQRYW